MNDRPTNRDNNAENIDSFAGEKLTLRRSLLGMSAKKLAHKIGISEQEIEKYENGEATISTPTLHKIGQSLSVPVNYFLPEDQGLPNSSYGMADNAQEGFGDKDEHSECDSDETYKKLRELISVIEDIDGAEKRQKFIEQAIGMAKMLKK